ncbi:MAG: hypothetical protein DRO40_01560 [Thermoprotei archaeon]|nr:MAG: hypothetical protein DRO40_01560 [Thermoprotei archaeon]
MTTNHYDIRIRVKPLQKPLGEGYVTCIVNPYNVRSVFKPCIVFYADEYPIGEVLEFGVIYDRHIDIIETSLVTMKARQFQAILLDRKELLDLVSAINPRKYFISPWNVIDLYIPVNIIEVIGLRKALEELREMKSHVNPYMQGLINYLRRDDNNIQRLLNTKINVVVLS